MADTETILGSKFLIVLYMANPPNRFRVIGKIREEAPSALIKIILNRFLYSDSFRLLYIQGWAARKHMLISASGDSIHVATTDTG